MCCFVKSIGQFSIHGWIFVRPISWRAIQMHSICTCLWYSLHPISNKIQPCGICAFGFVFAYIGAVCPCFVNLECCPIEYLYNVLCFQCTCILFIDTSHWRCADFRYSIIQGSKGYFLFCVTFSWVSLSLSEWLTHYIAGAF